MERLVPQPQAGRVSDGDGATGRTAADLLEDVYNFEDVLLVGCILNTFIRRADVVKVACIAQLVNVIAPIMTEPGGPAWKQTTYWPYLFASRHGRGTALQLSRRLPRLCRRVADDVPYLDAAGVRDAKAAPSRSSWSTATAARRSTSTSTWRASAPRRSPSTMMIRHHDLEATNTAEHPDRVRPEPGGALRCRRQAACRLLPPPPGR